jgi:TRAP-type mannitol/chloroaromatic compound transport system substrate-binding protein
VGTVAAAAALSSLPKPAIAQGAPTIKWRLASSFPKSLDTLWGGAEHFCNRVRSASDGKFDIAPHAAGQLVPPLQVMDAVQNKTIEVGHTASYYYFGKDETFAFATAIPFGLNTRQMDAWMYHAGGNDLLNQFYKGYNIHHLPGGHTGAQMGGWFRREIKTPDDLKGLKMRIGGFAGRVMVKLGVVPQQIAGGDIYPALEKGTIDGAEWVGPYDDEKLGFNKVAQYYYYPGWWEGNAMVMTLVNQAKWNELPKLYQAVLTLACVEANQWSMARYDVQNPAALRRLVAGGTKLRAFPRSVMQACESAAYEVYAELMGKSEYWKRIYPAWKKFRDEQFLWFRVAEGSYENYAFYSKLGEGR